MLLFQGLSSSDLCLIIKKTVIVFGEKGLKGGYFFLERMLFRTFELCLDRSESGKLGNMEFSVGFYFIRIVF